MIDLCDNYCLKADKYGVTLYTKNKVTDSTTGEEKESLQVSGFYSSIESAFQSLLKKGGDDCGTEGLRSIKLALDQMEKSKNELLMLV